MIGGAESGGTAGGRPGQTQRGGQVRRAKKRDKVQRHLVVEGGNWMNKLMKPVLHVK